MQKFKRRLSPYLAVFFILLQAILSLSTFNLLQVKAQMPFYDLQPKDLQLRATFFTSYPTSSEERKSNIALATKSIHNYFIDVGAEFSFNQVVGPRTEKRGYKSAKIIANGKFVDGIGGGVCQVSTTLYNAVLLAGLQISEYHAHSLPVSYVAPSFDAMVNSGSADLRFVNNTKNPIILQAKADDTTLRISILGEPMKEKYIRQSVIKEYISPPTEQIIYDEKGEFPSLFEGEKKVLSYGKQGYISQASLIKTIDGKVTGVKQLRQDKYSPIRGITIVGTAVKPPEALEEQA